MLMRKIANVGALKKATLMMTNIHESHKKCIICGKEFVTNMDWKITCSKECARVRLNQREREKRQSNKKPKTCVVCGKEFIAHKSKLTCSPKCTRIHKTEVSRKYNAKNQEEYKSTFSNKAEPVNKQKKNVAEEAHKLRMWQQKEAKKLGLTYAQYIAMSDECIERVKKINAKAY